MVGLIIALHPKFLLKASVTCEKKVFHKYLIVPWLVSGIAAKRPAWTMEKENVSVKLISSVLKSDPRSDYAVSRLSSFVPWLSLFE